MPNMIIIEGTIKANEWVTLGEEDTLPNTGKYLIPLSTFLENANSITSSGLSVGVIIDGTTELGDLQPHLDKLQLIAIHFSSFVDGRGYTLARELKERFKFSGEIRATGDVLQDQLFYLKRVGFDSFEIAEHHTPETAIKGLNDFSECYQVSPTHPTPLFSRR